MIFSVGICIINNSTILCMAFIKTSKKVFSGISSWVFEGGPVVESPKKSPKKRNTSFGYFPLPSSDRFQPTSDPPIKTPQKASKWPQPLELVVWPGNFWASREIGVTNCGDRNPLGRFPTTTFWGSNDFPAVEKWGFWTILAGQIKNPGFTTNI